MALFIIKRMEERPRSTWGYLYPPGADRYGHLCMTVERGERDPERRPRIPAGTYRLEMGGANIILLDVPRRKTFGLIAAASYVSLRDGIGLADSMTRNGAADWQHYGKGARWAFEKAQPLIAQACAADDAWLKIIDIAKGSSSPTARAKRNPETEGVKRLQRRRAFAA